MKTAKRGQYDETDGHFMFRYLVHKVMEKTADVTPLTSYMGSDYTGNRCYRYPLDLLEGQIENCRYIPFK